LLGEGFDVVRLDLLGPAGHFAAECPPPRQQDGEELAAVIDQGDGAGLFRARALGVVGVSGRVRSPRVIK
jgi:hypothetical protein